MARSLGPAIINRTFPHYFWIYFLGPLLGSLLASGFYGLLKMLRWQECNPNQDWDGMEKGHLEQKQRYTPPLSIQILLRRGRIRQRRRDIRDMPLNKRVQERLRCGAS